MAVTYQYNETSVALATIFRATVGGTVFSSNLYASSATMDYFTDTAVVNDAIYFGRTLPFSDLILNVGTQLAAVSIAVAWEFYDDVTEAWIPLEQCTDNTNAFQTAGVNTVVFPLQHSWKSMAVNSVTSFWVRCRITAIDTITEGGANQTTAPYGKDGFIRFVDSTAEDPATVEGLYQWLVANHPEVEATKTGTTNPFYHIPRAEIKGHTYYLSGENLYLRIGSDDINSSSTSIQYHNNWVFSDATIYLDHQRSGNYFYLQSSTLTRVLLISNNQNLRITGTGTGNVWTDVSIVEGSDPFNLRSFEGSGTFKRVSIGSYLSLGGFSGTTQDVEFRAEIQTYSSNNINLRECEFTAPGRKLMVTLNSGKPTYTFINNKAKFDDITETTGPLRRYISSLPLYKCYFYDDSAGTYTDYTTAATNATAGDVPLSGDVGDCLYFYSGHAFWEWNHVRGQGANFTIGTPNTDYVYAIEWYNGSAWEELVLSQELLTEWGDYDGYDATLNFAQSGKMLFVPRASTGNVLVNGITDSWCRIRIVTKGTGTPTLSSIATNAEECINFWHAYEKYTLDLTVKDTLGAINGATVTVTDSDGIQVVDTTTDENGAITQQALTYKDFYLDPFNVNSYPTYTEVVQKTYGDFTLNISKSGYITQTHKITMDEKKDLVFTLEKQVSVYIGKGKAFVNTNPADGQNNILA